MKRNIVDYQTPHIVGKNRARQSGRGSVRQGAWGNRRSKRLNGRRVFALVLGVFLAVSVAVTALVIYAPFNIRLKKTEFFMLILSSQSTLAGAKEAAEAAGSAGGAGFVISDGEFRIAAFVYQNRRDADSVLARLTEDYPQAEVLSYCHKRTKIKRFGSRAHEKKLKEVLDYPSVFAQEILSLVYGLDSFSMTESGAMLALDSLAEDLKKREENAAALLSEFSGIPAVRLAADYFAEIAASISQIGIKSDKKLTVSLKSLACEVVYKNYLMREKLEVLY